MRQQLSWSRGAPRPLRRWEVKYGSPAPLTNNPITCLRCGSSQRTFRRVQDGYICTSCMKLAERRAARSRPVNPAPAAKEASVM